MFRHLNADQRRALVIELIDAVTEAALLGSLVYLRPAEYENIASSEFRSRYGSAYATLISLQLLQISQHFSDRPDFPLRTRVFVEQGHANDGDALRAIGHWKFDTEPAPEIFEGEEVLTLQPDPRRTSLLRIDDYALGSKESMYPLHAADMFAYLAHSALSFKIDRLPQGSLRQSPATYSAPIHLLRQGCTDPSR